jgi:hypothetical protein
MGVKGYWCHLRDPVIPAKAGIQSDDSTFLKGCGVDSRFRGNDRCFRGNDRRLEWIPIPNETSTQAGHLERARIDAMWVA